MSSKFQLNIPNRLPKGLEAQALKDTYLVTIPFHWAAGNGKKSQEGDSLLCAVVLLTTNGYGYRICAVMNEKIGN
jgi:hypothetical protein